MALRPISGNAFAVTGQQWLWDWNSVNCGAASPAGYWNACVIHYHTTAALNSMTGWHDTATLAAGWWYLYDGSPYNRLDFQFVEDGRTSAKNAGVEMGVGDLGGRNANGIITLGLAQWTYYIAPYNALYQVWTTTSTNSGISWHTGICCASSTEYDMAESMIHELGHGLGLHHPVNGPNSWAIMQCAQAYGESDRPKADDVTGESWLYAQHRQDFGTPGSIPC
jgi:hypothetical protein